ncbi:hypothetical protein ACFL5L_02540 [candidate division KSB1 bacterium]
MGANFKSFEVGTSSGPLNVVFLILLSALAIFIGYKLILYYKERRKWSWFISLCKEKRLGPKEMTYLKQMVVRKKITSIDDLFGSLYQLNLPTPIKRKLLFDDAPVASARVRK